MASTKNEPYEPEKFEQSDTELQKRSETVPAEWSKAADRLLDAIKDMDR